MFQPHRYSRTASLLKEFCTSFHDADMLFITDIYPAGEEPQEGVHTQVLLEKIQAHGQKQAFYVADLDTLASQVTPYLQDGDIILTLGAGNIWQAGEQVLSLLKEQKKNPN